MNEITLPRGILAALLSDAAEIGANAALSRVGIIKPYLSKQDAYRMYGRAIVDRWIQERLITPRKDDAISAKWRIDRTEIEGVAKACNRPCYRQVKER